MKNLKSLIAAFAFCVFYGAVTVAAQTENRKNTPYVGVDAGISLSLSPEFVSDGNDVPSRCDLHFAGDPGLEDVPETNPARVISNVSDFNILFRGGTHCQDADSVWESKHSSSIGTTAGLTAGVAQIFGLPLRAEAEYLYRNNNFRDRADITLAGEKFEEFLPEFNGAAWAYLDNIQSHNLFANLYYDIPLKSKLSPYVGAGIGWSQTKFVMTSFWQRNDTGDTADNDGVHPDGHDEEGCAPTQSNDCVIEVLEGVVSAGIDKAHDGSTIAFQGLIGFDYPLSDRFLLGLKLRWAYFGEIETDPEEWDLLRDHPSTVVPEDGSAGDPADLEYNGGNNRIIYRTRLQSSHLLGAAVSLKYLLF